MNSLLKDSPEQVLADGFAAHVERWVRTNVSSNADCRALKYAASQLSLATSAGHVCIPLSDLTEPPAGPKSVEAWRTTLLSSGVVGTNEIPASLPLILDADNRLYLHRYFDYERRLAERLMRARAASSDLGGSIKRLKARLNELFAGNAARLGKQADWQKLAAALALRSKLIVISGGPGTGKTTTVVNLLSCLIELDPNCRIALAAPTGKAAARMTEAIRQRAVSLPEAIKNKLPTESFTVHRLLGVTPASEGFIHHAKNLLPIDALIVDEASMLDLALATKLLEAVPDSARIVLLGDKDQLSAVESGSVFSELSMDPTLSEICVKELSLLASTPISVIQPPEPTMQSALQDAVVWFTQNFRFAQDSGIGRIASLINSGEAQQTVDWMSKHADPSAEWIDDGAVKPSDQTMQRMADGYAPFMAAVKADPRNYAAVSKAFSQFRVLCAVRETPRGVMALNEAFTKKWLSDVPAMEADTSPEWFIGRPILVLRNDYVLKLFNGDIGIALPDEAGRLMVYFPLPDGSFRAIPSIRLPQHETAFAMTVHKSQGSEFDSVIVMLPAQPNRVLTKELLYTGVTRAKVSVAICSSSAVLTSALSNTTQRHSGLLSRLQESLPLQA